MSFGPLDGCVGPLNRISVKITKPERESIPAFFYRRECYYAIPVQAVCDSDYIFLYASGLCRGAKRDSLSNAMSELMEEVRFGLLRFIFESREMKLIKFLNGLFSRILLQL